jgi:hydroxymethylglutaryl-CoA lyase
MHSRAIELLEVGPRDGLQMEAQVVSTAVKIALIERLLQAGVRRIEVASFVNPIKVPQMADAESLLSQLHRPDGVYFTGLVLNRRGLERALAAGCNEIGMVVAASDSFNRRNQGVGTHRRRASAGYNLDFIRLSVRGRSAHRARARHRAAPGRGRAV